MFSKNELFQAQQGHFKKKCDEHRPDVRERHVSNININLKMTYTHQISDHRILT